jgi:hypothetical protein
MTSYLEAQNLPLGYGQTPPIIPSHPIGSERSSGPGFALPSSCETLMLGRCPQEGASKRHRNLHQLKQLANVPIQLCISVMLGPLLHSMRGGSRGRAG